MGRRRRRSARSLGRRGGPPQEPGRRRGARGRRRRGGRVRKGGPDLRRGLGRLGLGPRRRQRRAARTPHHQHRHRARGLRRGLGREPRQHRLADGLQGLVHAAPLARHRFEFLRALGVEERPEPLDRERTFGVTLVVLVDARQPADLRGAKPDAREVLIEVGQRLAVRELARGVRVGHEHHAVHPLEHRPARQPVVDLPRDGIKVEPGGEAVDLAELEGKEVEEQRPLVVGRDRDHPAAPLGREPVVQDPEVGGLPAEPRAVVDDLEMDLARPVIDERHQVLVRG